MSSSQELQTVRMGLEEESRSLNEERQKLEEDVKTLREKVAIEELRRNNQATRDAISQLRTEVGDLELKLNSLAHGSQPAETVAVAVATTAPEAPIVQQQVEERKPEERRRRFF